MTIKNVELGKTGEKIPILGQGTWGIKRFFKDNEYYEQWKDSLRKGIELGMTHIDTAEMYGLGKAEKVVGEIIEEYGRENLFITSKLFPMHIFHHGMKKAAEKSLERLGIKYFDLYLIHWPNFLVSITKQMKVLEELVNEGKTRYIGVSNFSIKKFKKAQSALKKEELVNNQLNASFTKQKHMYKSLPYYQEHNITMTAYSPLGHSGYTDLSEELRKKLDTLASKYNATIQQIAIAWLINHENVITIPKAFHLNHVKDNAEAADIKLSREDIELLYEDEAPEIKILNPNY
ncbi:MAG: aldo/keto reductase [Promethearchaeia archaeon]